VLMRDDWPLPDGDVYRTDRPVYVRPETGEALAYMLDSSMRMFASVEPRDMSAARVYTLTQLSKLIQRLVEMQTAWQLSNVTPEAADHFRTCTGASYEPPPSAESVEKCAFDLVLLGLKYLNAVCPDDVELVIAERVAHHKEGVRDLIAEKVSQLRGYHSDHPDSGPLAAELEKLVRSHEKG